MNPIIDWLGNVAIAILIFLFGLFCGASLMSSYWKDEAINLGHAEMAKSAKGEEFFKWKEVSK